jgi:hypothetical protein
MFDCGGVALSEDKLNLGWETAGPILGGSSANLTLPDYGRVARNPSRIDAKRGDHFL